MGNLTTIMITKENRDALKHIGYKDETYDEIIAKLIALAKKDAFFDRQKRILETDEFVPLD